MMTGTSMLSGTGLLSGVAGGTGGGSAGCDPSTDKACFASKVRDSEAAAGQPIPAVER